MAIWMARWLAARMDNWKDGWVGEWLNGWIPLWVNGWVYCIWMMKNRLTGHLVGWVAGLVTHAYTSCSPPPQVDTNPLALLSADRDPPAAVHSCPGCHTGHTSPHSHTRHHITHRIHPVKKKIHPSCRVGHLLIVPSRAVVGLITDRSMCFICVFTSICVLVLYPYGCLVGVFGEGDVWMHRTVGSLAVKHGGELVISVGRHRQGGASTIPKAGLVACYPSALRTHVGVCCSFRVDRRHITSHQETSPSWTLAVCLWTFGIALYFRAGCPSAEVFGNVKYCVILENWMRLVVDIQRMEIYSFHRGEDSSL